MPAAPQQNIRRFDVFAEWSRLTGLEKKRLPPEEAARYGYAVARVVAARKLHGYEPGLVTEWRRRARRHEEDREGEAWWDHVAKPTDFERKVIERMGEPFYRNVFQPAIRQAWDAGKKYEEVRDSIRKSWNDALMQGR